MKNIYVFILFNIFCNILFADTINKKIGLESDYSLVVSIKDQNSIKILKFSLDKLKKCKLHQDPFICNSIMPENYIELKSEDFNEIEKNGIKLNIFCIEGHLSQDKTRKCVFESLDPEKFVYIFDINCDKSEIKGILILNNKLQDILNNNYIDIDDFELDNYSVPEYKPQSKIVSLATRLGVYLLLKYCDLLDFVNNSKSYLYNLVYK